MDTIHVAPYVRTSFPELLYSIPDSTGGPIVTENGPDKGKGSLGWELSETMAPVIVASIQDIDSNQRQARRRSGLAARRVVTASLAIYRRDNGGDMPIDLVGALYDAAAVCGEAASLLYDYANQHVVLVVA